MKRMNGPFDWGDLVVLILSLMPWAIILRISLAGLINRLLL